MSGETTENEIMSETEESTNNTVSHEGVDFSVFSPMELKSLEKHLSYNGELQECQERTCRVYKLFNLHEKYDEIIKDNNKCEEVEFDWYNSDSESDYSTESEYSDEECYL